jgi:NhaP-type Na+/H+ or K+/H+ antiporter
MWHFLKHKAGFGAACIVVMAILHGNSKQFWPKIPYLSLRNESVFEHMRLLFNTFALVSLGQMVLGNLPRAHLPARVAVTVGTPAVLPLLIGLGSMVRLRGSTREVYNAVLVLLLPLVAAAVEDQLAARMFSPPDDAHA